MHPASLRRGAGVADLDAEFGYSFRVRKSRIARFTDGVDVVSKHHRSFLLALLLPAFLVVSVFAVVQAQEGRAQSARPTNWSAPATWPDGKVPVAGDKVTIPAGK